MGSVVMDGLMGLVVRVLGIGMLSPYILKPEFSSPNSKLRVLLTLSRWVLRIMLIYL